MARQLLQKVQQIKPPPETYTKATLWSSLPAAGWKMRFVALEEKEVAAIARVNEFDVLRNTIGELSLLLSLFVFFYLY